MTQDDLERQDTRRSHQQRDRVRQQQKQQRQERNVVKFLKWAVGAGLIGMVIAAAVGGWTYAAPLNSAYVVERLTVENASHLSSAPLRVQVDAGSTAVVTFTIGEAPIVGPIAVATSTASAPWLGQAVCQLTMRNEVAHDLFTVAIEDDFSLDGTTGAVTPLAPDPSGAASANSFWGVTSLQVGQDTTPAYLVIMVSVIVTLFGRNGGAIASYAFTLSMAIARNGNLVCGVFLPSQNDFTNTITQSR